MTFQVIYICVTFGNYLSHNWSFCFLGFQTQKTQTCVCMIIHSILFCVYFYYFIFFLFIEFIGLTLANNIIQVSGAQFHTTSSVHCIVYHPYSSLLSRLGGLGGWGRWGRTWCFFITLLIFMGSLVMTLFILYFSNFLLFLFLAGLKV